MKQKHSKSSEVVAKAIVFVVGIILASIGTIAGYYGLQLANSTIYMEYKWLWVTLLAALCFFMLRGAWHTVFYKPESAEEKFSIGGSNRSF